MKMTVKTAKLDELVPDPANARKHSDRQLAAIEASLREFGQRRPLVVTTDNVVVAGNGTLEAARRLGWETISVTVVPSSWTPAQIRGYAIADNRTADLASWDDELLAASLQELEAADLLEAAGYSSLEFDDLRARTEEEILPVAAAAAAPAGESGTRSTPSLSEYAERYADKATQVLMCDYPKPVYVWLVSTLARLRQELGIDNNAETVLHAVESLAGERAPR